MKDLVCICAMQQQRRHTTRVLKKISIKIYKDAKAKELLVCLLYFSHSFKEFVFVCYNKSLL